MSSIEQSVTLLRRNKRAMVAGLQSNGYNVTDTMRAADFPDFARWGSGLLDLQVCAVKISDGSIHYFLVADWLNLTQANRDLYVKKGLRVRALGEDFIIAPETLSGNMAQCITLAGEYKAHTQEIDGVDDTCQWSIPTKHQVQLFYRYRAEINQAFTDVWSSSMGLINNWHWTKTPSGSNSWRVNVATGVYEPAQSSWGARLRPVCVNPCLTLKQDEQ